MSIYYHFISFLLLSLVSLLSLSVVSCQEQPIYDPSPILGNQIGVLITATFKDFGYNNRIVVGVREMEQALSISGCTIVDDITSQSLAIDAMESLVLKGFRLIASTTSAHGNASFTMAKKYPHIFFAESTTASGADLPNLFQLTWASIDMYYSMGVFASAMSPNGKVGFVHPGPPVGPINAINGFYLGIKAANPEATMHLVETGSYVDPDVAKGAVKILLEDVGVDFLSSMLDDYSLQEDMMSRGLLALGTTGYPLKELYGQDVALSIVRQWTRHMLELYNRVQNATRGLPYVKRITGTFSGGNLMFDEPSYRVPSGVWSKTEELIRPLYSAKTPYYCSPFVSEFGMDPNTGCLSSNNTGQMTRTILSGVHRLGKYVVPVTTNTKYILGTRITAIIASSIGILCCIGLFATVLVWKNRTSIKRGSYRMLLIIIFGALMMFVGVIMWALDPDTMICRARVWLPSLAFTISMGTMNMKNFRVVYAFLKDRFEKFKQVDVGIVEDPKLTACVLFAVVINIILLSIHTGVGVMEARFVQGVQGLGKYERMAVCYQDETATNILYAIIAYHVKDLFIGCVLAFKVRDAALKEFKESGIIGNTILMVSIIVVIMGTLIGASESTYTQSITYISFGLLAGVFSMLIIMFSSKIINAYKWGKGEIDESYIPDPAVRGQKGISMSISARNSNNSSNGKSSGSSSAEINNDKASRNEKDRVIAV